jgi:hypothetical protein
MAEEIPTAREWVSKMCNEKRGDACSSACGEDAEWYFIEFAKMHIEKALREAKEIAESGISDSWDRSTVMDEIEKCYSLEDIK